MILTIIIQAFALIFCSFLLLWTISLSSEHRKPIERFDEAISEEQTKIQI